MTAFHECLALLRPQELDWLLHVNFQGFAKGLFVLTSRWRHLRISLGNSIIIIIFVIIIDLAFVPSSSSSFSSTNSYLVIPVSQIPVVSTLEGQLDLFFTIATNCWLLLPTLFYRIENWGSEWINNSFHFDSWSTRETLRLYHPAQSQETPNTRNTHWVDIYGDNRITIIY